MIQILKMDPKTFDEDEGGSRSALGDINPNTPGRKKRQKEKRKSMKSRRCSFAPPAELVQVREYEKNNQEWKEEPMQITDGASAQAPAPQAEAAALAPKPRYAHRKECGPLPLPSPWHTRARRSTHTRGACAPSATQTCRPRLPCQRILPRLRSLQRHTPVAARFCERQAKPPPPLLLLLLFVMPLFQCFVQWRPSA